MENIVPKQNRFNIQIHLAVARYSGRERESSFGEWRMIPLFFPFSLRLLRSRGGLGKTIYDGSASLRTTQTAVAVTEPVSLKKYTDYWQGLEIDFTMICSRIF